MKKRIVILWVLFLFLGVPTLMAATPLREIAKLSLAQAEVLLQGVDSTGVLRNVLVDTSGRLILSSSGAAQADYQCSTASPTTVTSVGTNAVAVPATNAASRVSVLLCNSAENAGSPKVKCRNDGVPVMGITAAGHVLAKGDCWSTSIASGIQCISDTASTAVTTSECL